ncbi:hypothetical protein [Cognatitamlana onchidii]|uniref:hypothetical protein n=1 Tax=Cognatitamlana onchidii TaxID=2562860 RepID=UPI0010A5C696|nr:hypothetical protein [Algibacter onchidii]
MRLRIRFLLIVFFVGGLIAAQENNYWNFHQGAIASLTGGAAVANAKNQAAAYYNPGLLPFVKNNSVSLNMQSFFFNSLLIENGAGDHIDLEQSAVGIVPSSSYGVIKNNEESKWTLSFGIITQAFSDYGLGAYNETQLDVISSNPGEETYLANYNYNTRLKENWLGLATGYEINKNFGVGLTTFIVAKSIDYIQSTNASAILVDQENDFVRTIANTSLNENFAYRSAGLVFKLGLSYRIENLRLGLTLSSPLINVDFIGKGNINRELFITSDNTDESNIRQVAFQEKINTINKLPFALDLGATYQFGKTELSARIAHYLGVGTYELIEKEEFDNSSMFNQFSAFGVPKTAIKSVTNFGIGLAQELNAKTTLYLGFNTDNNSFDDSKLNRATDFVPSISQWDLMNVSAGLSHYLKHFQLIYGLSYISGRSTGDSQIINISDPLEENFLLGELTSNTKTSINQLNLNIGFVYYF